MDINIIDPDQINPEPTNQDIKILVADDDPEILFATARVIKKAGYQTYTADSGKKAMEAVKTIIPDLILLDVVMPDAEGPDLCRRIKDDPKLKGIYVLLTSGARVKSDQQADGLDSGADGYIARPLSNRELLSRVNSMVRILRAERVRDLLIVELKKALAEIKTLSGLLPICSHCKQVRDDKGYWSQIESYISAHSDAHFSHSICPECAKKHYPEFDLYD
ncbi:MAG: response regulator [Desulfobacterales bacterium]|nr:response regulator [Desulfobacterales bacterium]